MQGKRVNIFTKFLRDTEALVTVQVVMFSVMLFGGIGLMMDFGRAYSAHSHMQSYIDQVALAAARELDQTGDAISRATSAADAVAGSSNFVSTGDFSYDQIVFLTGAPTGNNGEYDESLVSTFNTANPLQATHVLVKSSSESVALQLLKFASNGSEGIADIGLRTQAVATSRKVACGGLSPIVMCNPFENDSSTSFREAMATGYRMKLTADAIGNSKPSSASDKIQLGLLKNPHDTMHVRNTACTDITYLPGASTMTGVSTETLRDICLLATVDTGLSCINDEVVFKSADPYSVTTGLNVIFDMFDDSMADIMDPSLNSSFSSPFPATLGTNITRASLFYPDAAAPKGRLSRESYMQHIDEQIFLQEAIAQELIDNAGAAPACPPGLPAFLCPKGLTGDDLAAAIADIEDTRDGIIASLQTEKAAYAPYAIDAIEASSRMNYVRDIGEATEWGFPTETPCLVTENCTLHGVINGTVTGSNNVDSYGASFYQPYILQEIAIATGVTNWWEADPTMIDIDYITNGTNYPTYYDFYVGQERANTALQDAAAVDGTAYPAVTALALTDADFADKYLRVESGGGEHGLSMSPTNYLSAYPGGLGTEERRRQRVTVVNCSAAETYSSATGSADTAYEGAFVGDVVDVVDLFLLAPPQVTACNNAPVSDPQNNLLCANQDIVSVDLDVEFVDSASSNQVAFDSRTFAVLVH